MFATDITLNRSADDVDEFYGVIGSQWLIGTVANGGFVQALLAKTMSACLPDHPRLVSVTSRYLRPVVAGDIRVTTDVVRVGRGIAICRAELTAGADSDKVCVIAEATFATEPSPGNLKIDHRSQHSDQPPKLPPFEELETKISPLQTELSKYPGLVRDSVELRFVADTILGNTDATDCCLEYWQALRTGEQVDQFALVLFTDSGPPPMFKRFTSMGWIPTLELTTHISSSVDSADNLYSVATKADCQTIIDGYAEVSAHLWSPSGEMLAVGRQVMLVPDFQV